MPDSPAEKRDLLQQLSQLPWPEEQSFLVRSVLSSHSSLEEKLTILLSLSAEFPDINNEIQNSTPETQKSKVGAESDAAPAHSHENEVPEEGNEPRVSEEEDPLLSEGPLDEHTDVPRAIENPKEIERNRRSLITSHTEGGFLSYILEDIWKIIPFSREKKVIEGKFFYLTIRISPSIEPIMALSLQKRTIVPLQDILKQILRKGWRVLSKSHYNLLRLLQDLCEALLEIDFSTLQYDNKELLNEFLPIEQLFFAIIQVDPRIDHTADALRSSYQAMPELPGSIGSTLTLVKRILLEDGLSPSLTNLIIGLNIVRYRKYLLLDDLTSSPGGRILSEDNFDAPETTQREIRHFLKELEKSLIPLIKKKDKFKKQQASTSTMAESYDELKLFYDFSGDLSEQASRLFKNTKGGLESQIPSQIRFETDKNLPLILTFRFCQRANESLNPLLSGTFPTSDGIIRIFSREIFGFYFDKIKEVLPILEELIEKVGSSIDTSGWEHMQKRTVDQKNKVEKQITSSVDSIVTNFTMIQGLLNSILQKHTPALDQSPQIPIDARSLGNEHLQIPNTDSIVEQQDLLLGKSVSEALFYTQEVISQYLSLLNPGSKVDSRGNLEEVEISIQNVLKSITRIGPKAYSTRVRRKYGI